MLQIYRDANRQKRPTIRSIRRATAEVCSSASASIVEQRVYVTKLYDLYTIRIFAPSTLSFHGIASKHCLAHIHSYDTAVFVNGYIYKNGNIYTAILPLPYVAFTLKKGT